MKQKKEKKLTRKIKQKTLKWFELSVIWATSMGLSLLNGANKKLYDAKNK
jgi:hypothetical protein